ncbi:lPXTG-motif cell wall anchor domain protein [Clostridium sp. CAG:575]|nr:lPXTG-motif cell wall anchor domain protein [Clostridium sp. CAG:575]
MSQKKKNSFSTSIKMIVFLIIVLLIARVAMIIFGNGKVNTIEGYLYSFASSATEADATSSDATSSDATSSDATSCDATSSDATSSNVQNSEAIKQQQHLQQIQQVVEEKEEEEKTTLKETVTYRNDELTSKLIAEITESENIKTIIINADDSPKISSDIFKAIQNTYKQLVITYKDNEFVFNGRNIKNPKDIDASISVNSIQTDIDISKIVKSNGIVVSFEPNGELPGVAKVRIKSTDTLKKNIDGNKVYAYYYDEQNKNFILMSEDVKLSEDEYYEFAIEHNSKYILVNEKVDETLLAGYIAPTQNNQKETVSFLESHKAYIMIIGMCIFAIVLISVIVIVDKRGIKKRKMMAQQKQNEDERVPKAFSKNNE